MIDVDRAKDFKDVLCSITNDEWNNYTKSQWADWFNAWNGYVTTLSGVRPPNRPPV